jgi:hypothetical protein
LKDEGAKFLGVALEKINSLSSMNLNLEYFYSFFTDSDNDLSEDTTKTLVSALEKFKNLVSLKLNLG